MARSWEREAPTLSGAPRTKGEGEGPGAATPSCRLPPGLAHASCRLARGTDVAQASPQRSLRPGHLSHAWDTDPQVVRWEAWAWRQSVRLT